MRERIGLRLGQRSVHSRVGLLVVAVLAGMVVPMAVVAYVAYRDPDPRSCRTGVATSAQVDGVIAWGNASVLWYSNGDLSRARRLVDYTPARPAPSPGASPAAAGSPQPSPSPAATAASPNVTLSASPSPGPPAPAFEAAVISPDRRLVAFMVSNAPLEPGMASLRLVSPLDPPGTAAVEIWSGPWLGGARERTEISLLPAGQFLVKLPSHFDPPETSKRLVMVAAAGTTDKVIESAPEKDFEQTAHSTWPETKTYQPPPAHPKLIDRIIGPNNIAAGELRRELRTPLVHRSLYELAVGRAGSRATTIICASTDPLSTTAFSPDGHLVAVLVHGNTDVLDLGEGRALAFLLRGRVLDWRG